MSKFYFCAKIQTFITLKSISFPFTVDDTLDSVLAGSDEEEETEAVVGQVLDEIGIDISSKVCRQRLI